MDGKTILPRSEVPEEFTWDLRDVFASDEAWNEELEALKAYPERMAAFAGRLGESAKTLLDWFTLGDEVNVRAAKLLEYASCRSDQDVGNSFYQGMRSKAFSAAVALSSASAFEASEIMDISDETLARFYAEEPKLETYRRNIDKLRRRKAHTLSAAEEKLLASAGEMSQAPDTIYGSLADADLKFPDAVDAKGNKHPLTQGTFVSLEESSDRVLRQSAYENLYGTLASFKTTTAAILNAQNKQLKFFAEARKYDTAFEASLDATNVPTSVYKNLIETVHQNMDKMHRYVRLRKKLLGVDELHFYDVYTPLLKDVDKHIPYEQAKQTVYDALAPLGDDYRTILKNGFDHRWIDVYQNEGKRSGAYSAGTVVHPYVLLNYTGTLDSQFTLAHEMGHALHSYLSNKHQNPIDADYVIFVAEVASTCNEALLMEYLLGKTTDKKERAYLLNHFMESFRGTVFRQTMFAEFEKITHEKTAAGETLNAQSLCKIYGDLNALYFGPDMTNDPEISLEWARIPHFYMPFYVYQYATGFSAAIALSHRILTEGQPAVEDYINFLKAGGSDYPINVLKKAGVDMTTKFPVASALSVFSSVLDEAEKVIAELGL